MTDMLEDYFDKCKEGKMGVMPYYEGCNSIEFVWTNGKGLGRECKISLTKEGKIVAWKLYQEISKLNKEKTEEEKE